MYLFDLKSILSKLNANLYIDDSKASYTRNGFKVTGIYQRVPKVKISRINKFDWHQADARQQRYLRDSTEGHMDKFICGVAIDHLPEYDVFNLDEGTLSCPGWRSIAHMLIKQKIASPERIKKLFRCSSIGEADYDKLDYMGKLNLIRKRIHA